jgi:hypothetical protein
MVTKREVEWVEFWASWFSRCKILALEWNPQTKLLSVTTKKWKIVANAIHLIWQSYAACFSIIRIQTALNPHSEHDGQVGLKLQAMYMLVGIIDFAIFLAHLSVTFSRTDLADLLNQLLAFNNQPSKSQCLSQYFLIERDYWLIKISTIEIWRRSAN